MLDEYREKLKREFGRYTPADLEVRIRKNDGIDVAQARDYLRYLAEEEREAELKRAREAVQSAKWSAFFAMVAAVAAAVGVAVDYFK